MELKQIKKADGDSKKSRVLIEFDAGTDEYKILKYAQEKGYSVSATLKDDVSKLVKTMGGEMGVHKPATPTIPKKA